MTKHETRAREIAMQFGIVAWDVVEEAAGMTARRVPHQGLVDAIASALQEQEETIKWLRFALQVFETYGCPVCRGDCASANPPVAQCPMLLARAALSGKTP
jgi:hypothetical protein